MKYVESGVTCVEVPDEVSQYYVISGCPMKCPECHSKDTWDIDKGIELTSEELEKKIKSLKGVSCILFLGGEWYEHELVEYLKLAHKYYLHTALYTGLELKDVHQDIIEHLKYIKVGRYNEEYGPITSRTTNQRMYRVEHFVQVTGFKDITEKFWR